MSEVGTSKPSTSKHMTSLQQPRHVLAALVSGFIAISLRQCNQSPVSGNLVYSFAIGQLIRPHIYSGEELPLFGESLLSREGYNCCKAVTALQHKPVHGIPVAGTAVTGFVMKDNEDDMDSSMFPKGAEAGNAATITIRTIRKVAGQTKMPPRYSKEFIATSSMTEQWIRRGLYPYVARSMETMASGLDDADGRVMKFLDSIQSNLSEDELQMEMGTFTSTGKRWIAAKLSQDSKNKAFIIANLVEESILDRLSLIWGDVETWAKNNSLLKLCVRDVVERSEQKPRIFERDCDSIMFVTRSQDWYYVFHFPVIYRMMVNDHMIETFRADFQLFQEWGRPIRLYEAMKGYLSEEPASVRGPGACKPWEAAKTAVLAFLYAGCQMNCLTRMTECMSTSRDPYETSLRKWLRSWKPLRPRSGHRPPERG